MKFFYFRKPAKDHEVRGQPVACVAYETGTDSNTGFPLMAFGISVWCPRDRWNKEHGRALAAGRLATNPIVIPYNDRVSALYEIAYWIKTESEWGSTQLPTRLVRAAQSWLKEMA